MDNDLYGWVAFAMIGLVVYMGTSVLGLSSVGLEGRAGWVVFGSPVSRAALLRAKWAWAFGWSAGLTALLTAIAGASFGVAWRVTAAAALAFGVACFALTGLSVGLSALFPRFVTENPAHRASLAALIWGFGLATAYLVAVGLIAALAWLEVVRAGWPAVPTVWGAAGLCLLVSAVTAFAPVFLGARRLGRWEWDV